MCPDSPLPPEDDIQQALEQAQNPMSSATNAQPGEPGEVLAESSHCPILGLRYAMAKCGMLAEKYPWQTLAALLLSTACAWVCTYFGATMLLGLFLYAVYGDE